MPTNRQQQSNPPPSTTLRQEDLAREEAAELPNRDVMSLLDVLPGTAGPVPLPLDSAGGVPQTDVPDANAGATYDPSVSSTASGD